MKIHPVNDYYQALLDRDPRLEGIVFFGIKTTGIVCRPTCPARKPKRENCEFFPTLEAARSAGFRPCKRCRPEETPGTAPEELKRLLAAIEAQPDRRFGASELAEYGLSEASARRHFKERFGLSFVQYLRGRRMGTAKRVLERGAGVLDAQAAAGYESSSGFREAFARALGQAPSRTGQRLMFAEWFESPLGAMVAVGDETHLWLLEFCERTDLAGEMRRLEKREGAAILPGEALSTRSIRRELKGYFAGKVRTFETPLGLSGTPFQRACWQTLQMVPYGCTRTYQELAHQNGRATAVRAVAQANARNHLAIVLPCHRIIGSDGSLTGYAAGVHRKRWLLDLEARAGAT